MGMETLSNCDNGGRPCPHVSQQWTPPGAPTPGNPGNTTLRFWTDQFPGAYISHCHLLTHEDEGMMFWVNVSGSPGQVSAQAQQLDPTCYTGHLEGQGFMWYDHNAKKGFVADADAVGIGMGGSLVIAIIVGVVAVGVALWAKNKFRAGKEQRSRGISTFDDTDESTSISSDSSPCA